MKANIFACAMIALFSFAANAEPSKISGAISAEYDEQGHISQVTIKRSGKDDESIKFTAEEALLGYPEIHLAALNAYISSGKAKDVPLKFASGKELIDFAISKNRQIDGSVSNPTVKVYIANLKMVYAQQLFKNAECKLKLQQQSASGPGSAVA